MNAGIIGALAGLGQGIANTGKWMMEKDREEERDNRLAEKQKELERLRQAHVEQMAAEQLAANSEQHRLDRELRSTEGEADRRMRGEIYAHESAKADAREQTRREDSERQHKETMKRMDSAERRAAAAERRAEAAAESKDYGYGTDAEGKTRRGKWQEDGRLMAGKVELTPVLQKGEKDITAAEYRIMKEEFDMMDDSDPRKPLFRIELENARTRLLMHGDRGGTGGSGLNLLGGEYGAPGRAGAGIIKRNSN